MVSIILPVYNRQDYIEECVNSIQAQSYQNFEIIIIDDGSTDESLKICMRLANEDARIHLLAADHCGVSAARNTGIGAAKGDYIFFIDSDDAIHPHLIESLINGLKKSDASIACTKPKIISEKSWHREKKILDKDCQPAETIYQNPEQSLHSLFHGLAPLNMIGGIMIRRDWLENTLFHRELIIGEDYYFVYENLIKGASTIYLKKSWYYCRYHQDNNIKNYSYTAFWSRFYRRVLTWQSEEKMGRPHYARQQKSDAFSLYLNNILQKTLTPEDTKKANKAVKSYAKEMFAGLNPLNKLRFIIYLYIPGSIRIILPIENKFKKLIQKVRIKK